MVYKSRRKNSVGSVSYLMVGVKIKLQQKYTITLQLVGKKVLAKQYFFCVKKSQKKKKPICKNNKEPMKFTFKSTEIMQHNMSAQNTEIQTQLWCLYNLS